MRFIDPWTGAVVLLALMWLALTALSVRPRAIWQGLRWLAFTPRRLATAGALVFLGLALWGCTNPTQPTPPVQQQPQPYVLCINGSCNTGTPTGASPSPTAPACPGSVTRVGINVPSQISIGQPAGSYVADATPRGPGDIAFNPDCRPLPSVIWITTAACTVSDVAAYRPLLRGLLVGDCDMRACVAGVCSPVEQVQVIP